ncbi:hypothetical protein HMPREF1640_05675 [Prevotella sp. S7-1-8]|nr:hypothetical protein HMPREF1640_05675 [Prevotella sp. S7-1-8]
MTFYKQNDGQPRLAHIFHEATQGFHVRRTSRPRYATLDHMARLSRRTHREPNSWRADLQMTKEGRDNLKKWYLPCLYAIFFISLHQKEANDGRL